MLLLKSAAVFLASVLPLVAAAPAAANVTSGLPDVRPNKYIVQLKPDADVTKHLSWINDIHARGIAKRGALPALKGFEKSYEFTGFKAYSGEFDAATVELIKRSSDVKIVEPEVIFYPTDFHSLESRAIVARGYAPWGIQVGTQRPRASGNTAYTDDTAGQNTWVYIIDSGINCEHQDFEGRAINAWTAYPSKPNTDTMGHGTHCAGIAGARTFGFSLKTNLVSVKVFDNGGAGAEIMDGYAWAVNDIKSKGRVGRAVLSMSLGGGKSQTTNDAIKAAYDQGILTVAAAGNSNVDAANTSPASAPEAVTVGAMDVNYARASFSNFGSIVDIFAPGVDIISTYIGSTTALKNLSGTSMAAPHVAGLAVYFIALAGKALQPIEIVNRIVYCASYDALSGIPSGTKNALIYNCSGK